MAAVAALLSLCFGALSPCPRYAGPLCIGELAGGLGYPRNIAFSHDDTLAAVASDYGGLHVYNMSTGAALTVPSNDTEAVWQTAFSPDGIKVAVALGSTGVAVVSTNGTELWSATSNGDCLSVAYSPDGTRVASGHKDGNISIWDAETGALVLSLPGGYRDGVGVVVLAFTIDGGRLISGSYDPAVVVWDATTGAVLKTLYDAFSIQVSPDGLYFASLWGTGSAGAVIIYKLSDYSIYTAIRNGRTTYDMSFSQDGSKLVLVGYGDMEVYSVETGKLLQSHTMPSGRTSVASYFYTSDTIITGARNRRDASLLSLVLWNDVAPTPPPTPAPATPDAPLAPCPSRAGPLCTKMLARVPSNLLASGLEYPLRIAVSHDDTLVAVAARSRGSRGLHVYNVTTGAVLPAHSPYLVYDVAFSPDARNVAVALGSGGVAVVSLSSGRELWFGKMTGLCKTVAYSPDGTRVASSDDGNIHIWNALTGALEVTLPGATKEWDGVGRTEEWDQLTYTIDGGRLISVEDYVGKVVVWDATTGAILKTLADAQEQHKDVVRATPVSPDGLYFATMTTDGTLNIYKLSDYSIHQRISLSVTFEISSMSFSHDWSKVVLVGSFNMQVYSVQTGELLQYHSTASQLVYGASYFHTSDTIITGGYSFSSGGLFLWDDVAPTTATPGPTHADDDLSAGAIAGIVVGSVLAVVVLAALLVWCVRRAPDTQDQDEPNPQELHGEPRNGEPVEV